MALNLDKNLKVYHNISEVAKMFDVSESTLRYWEQEFPFLKPKTLGSSKIRQYSDKDIETVRTIYNLVKIRGFRISNARKILAHNPKGVDKKVEVLDKLINIRNELQALRKQLDYLQ